MRLLVVTFYYPPDLSAGSFRVRGLVAALARARDAGWDLEVDVITTQPNRYRSTSGRAASFEDSTWLRVHRLDLPLHASGMRDQAIAFASFARGARRVAAGGEWDVVFATSSRLMTAALAAALSRRLHARLYLDIRDLFADTMASIFEGRRFERPLGSVLERIERWTLRSATRISSVSPGFLAHIRSIVGPVTPITVFTNGIDDEFLVEPSTTSPLGERPVVLYAGNIGEGQGLEHVVPELAASLGEEADFVIIGDGGRRGILESRLADAGVRNVRLLDPMPRAELLEQYHEADILFLHLNAYDAFLKVLPSKIFEYAAVGKPMVAGIGGVSADFVRDNIAGAEVVEPLDIDQLAAAVRRAARGPAVIPRTEFVQRHGRDRIMDDLVLDLRGLEDDAVAAS